MGLLTGKASVIDSIPSMNSKFEDWIQWHKNLKAQFGKKLANSEWIKGWKIRGSSSANKTGLREYLADEGIQIDESAWDEVMDLGVGVTDFFGDVFSVGKYVTLGIVVIVVGGLAMLVFNIAKNPAENVGLATRAFVTKGK